MEYSVIKESKSIVARRFFAYFILTLFSALALFFFYLLLINTTRTHNEISSGFSLLPGKAFMTNVRNVLNPESLKNLPIHKGLLNSVIVSTGTAILAVYASSMTAYSIHVYHYKGRQAIFNFILLIMTIPTQVTALGFVQLVNKADLKGMMILLPLFVPAVASPVVMFFMKQYMDGSLPMEIVEAARIDGSGEFKTFNRIVLPILKPAIAVQMIFTFVGAWNNYFVPALLINDKNYKTLPILIAELRGADFLKFDMGKVYVLIAIAILPVMIVYFALSKFIIAGVTLGGMKE